MSQIIDILFPLLLVFGAPLLIGISLLRRPNKTTFGRYAGLLTLKPLVATPLWYSIFASNLNQDDVGLLLMLPGALLTIVLAVAYTRVFRDYKTSGKAWKLLALDCAGWITSGLWALIVPGAAYSGMILPLCGIIAAALVLPTIFAFVALRMTPDWAEKAKR